MFLFVRTEDPIQRDLKSINHTGVMGRLLKLLLVSVFNILNRCNNIGMLYGLNDNKFKVLT